MTKSKAQQKAEAEEKAREEAVLNDPGQSPTDVNKDSSGAAPIPGGVTNPTERTVEADDA